MMTRRTILIGAFCLLLACAAATAAVTAVVDSGSVVIRIRETSGDSSINLSIPATFAQATLLVLPDRFFSTQDSAINEWFPIVRGAVHSLKSSSDFTLVRVDTMDEQVEVAVSEGSFIVRVEDGGDSVYIRVPLKLTHAVFSKMERARATGPESLSPLSS